MYIFNFIQTKIKNQIICYDDIKIDQNEFDELRIKSYNKEILEKNLNIAFKEINNLIKSKKLPNYDGYFCYLLQIYDDCNIKINLNNIKQLIEIITYIEKIGKPSHSYVWLLKYLVYHKYNDVDFWEKIYITTNKTCQYICKLGLSNCSKSLLTDEEIINLLSENNSKCVLHDLKSLNISDEKRIVNLLDKIKQENGDLYQKIKNEHENE